MSTQTMQSEAPTAPVFYHMTDFNPDEGAVETIRVSGQSQSYAVAGAIAGVIRSGGRVQVQAIGARAVNQATKAVTIARRYLGEDGIDICFVPSFTEVEIDGNSRVALRFTVIVR